VIGTTVELLSRMKRKYNSMEIAFDTTHAALNKEDALEALGKRKNLIHQIRFFNAVLDKTND